MNKGSHPTHGKQFIRLCFSNFHFFEFLVHHLSLLAVKNKNMLNLTKNYEVKFSHFLGLFKLTAPIRPLFLALAQSFSPNLA
jgi:hypothetical protein